jgi:hypothetical protein
LCFAEIHQKPNFNATHAPITADKSGRENQFKCWCLRCVFQMHKQMHNRSDIYMQKCISHGTPNRSFTWGLG